MDHCSLALVSYHVLFVGFDSDRKYTILILLKAPGGVAFYDGDII